MKFVGYKSRPQGPVAAISKKEKTLGTMLFTCVMADESYADDGGPESINIEGVIISLFLHFS